MPFRRLPGSWGTPVFPTLETSGAEGPPIQLLRSCRSNFRQPWVAWRRNPARGGFLQPAPWLRPASDLPGRAPGRQAGPSRFQPDPTAAARSLPADRRRSRRVSRRLRLDRSGVRQVPPKIVKKTDILLRAAFAWRCRLLHAMCAKPSGVVKADGTCFRLSFKGRRARPVHADRAPSSLQVSVVPQGPAARPRSPPRPSQACHDPVFP